MPLNNNTNDLNQKTQSSSQEEQVQQPPQDQLQQQMTQEQSQQINMNDPEFQQFLKEFNEVLTKIHDYSPSPTLDINPLLAHGILTKQFDIKSMAAIFKTDLKYLFDKRMQIEVESLLKNYGKLVIPFLDKFTPVVDNLLKQIAKMSVQGMNVSRSPELKNIITKLIL